MAQPSLKQSILRKGGGWCSLRVGLWLLLRGVVACFSFGLFTQYPILQPRKGCGGATSDGFGTAGGHGGVGYYGVMGRCVLSIGQEGLKL
jgi:hypothetical protein